MRLFKLAVVALAALVSLFVILDVALCLCFLCGVVAGNAPREFRYKNYYVWAESKSCVAFKVYHVKTNDDEGWYLDRCGMFWMCAGYDFGLLASQKQIDMIKNRYSEEECDRQAKVLYEDAMSDLQAFVRLR